MADLDANSYVPGEVVVHLQASEFVRQLPVYRARALGSDEPPPSRIGIEELDDALEQFGARALFRVFEAKALPELAGIAVIRFEELNTVEVVLAVLNKLPSVVESSPHARVTVNAIPNDPNFQDLWGPPQINCPGAWDVTTGDRRVVIAVVDTGCDFNHPELSGQLLTGWNILNPGHPPQDDDAVEGHGTKIAGIIGAIGNNRTGIAGVNWTCGLLPVKALPGVGDGDAATVAQGIEWAVTPPGPAAIVNCSFIATADDVNLRRVIAAAGTSGALIVTASGNIPDGQTAPFTPYPGMYAATMAHVVCIGATDQNDRRCSFSNYGDWLTLVAPGISIESTMNGGGLQEGSGTSLAAPYVSGVVGLIRTAYPSMTAPQIKQRLKDVAKPLRDQPSDPVPNPKYGHGLVDARGCLTQLRLAFPANDGTNNLCIAHSGGYTFHNFVVAPPIQVGAIIASAELNHLLCLAFRAPDGSLRVSSTLDGVNFRTPTTPSPSVPLGGCVAMAVRNNQLNLVTPTPQGGMRYAQSSDGNVWTTGTVSGIPLGSCVAMAALNGTLYVVYPASDGTMCVTTSADGISWSPPSQTDIRLGSCVAMAVFNGKLYIAAQGRPVAGLPPALIFASSSDGRSFAHQGLAGQSPGSSIAMAVLNSTLHIAYQDSSSRTLVVLTPREEYVFTTPSPAVPLGNCAAMTVFNNALYLAWKATDSSQNMQIASSNNGTHWSGITTIDEQLGSCVATEQFNGKVYVATPNVTDPNHPRMLVLHSAIDGRAFDTDEFPQELVGNSIAMAVLNGTLYVAYQDNATHNLKVHTAEKTTTVGYIKLGSCAAMAVLRNTLFLAYKADDASQTMHVATSSDGDIWGAAQIASIQLGSCVAMAAFNGKLYVAGQKPDQSLFIASSNDGSSFAVRQFPQQIVGNCITMKVLNDTLYIAYQNNIGHNLVVAASSKYFDNFDAVATGIQLGSSAAMAVLRSPDPASARLGSDLAGSELPVPEPV
ncbi:S8 family serine peptidase [Mycobacterium sp. Aquia_213]|uniref:S8 family serine peptidase n=1 Tax=Mycobacterium sp. Aquia_213 TaxID=2991728 RepID=UPI00226E1521|nr:S8 family serine peptidase [Mycobacterium sp. Aquia_213]WAC93962.1 S8 family serine peptidase [Mycobacterium sp. Aquia_213]